jgi:hypothetical protein
MTKDELKLVSGEEHVLSTLEIQLNILCEFKKTILSLTRIAFHRSR